MIRVLIAFLAVFAIPRPGAADARLIEMLRSDRSAKVRAQAALALSRQQPSREITEALVAALDDTSPIVRGSAARALGEVGTDEAFLPLCRSAKDADKFVAKWAAWAAKRLLGRSRSIALEIRGLRVEPEFFSNEPPRQARLLAEDMTRHLQEGVALTLLETGRFDAALRMDFREDADNTAPGTNIWLGLSGGVVEVQGDRHRAEVLVEIEATAANGFSVWRGTAKGLGESQGVQENDNYADELSEPEEALDARIVAVRAAGSQAAKELVKELLWDYKKN